ncbi:hypothetical protein J6590_095316 [Homalodisca vitripennis]|nr:hypothetical protein J6590_095316 [Homalodisca vitripennis]
MQNLDSYCRKQVETYLPTSRAGSQVFAVNSIIITSIPGDGDRSMKSEPVATKPKRQSHMRKSLNLFISSTVHIMEKRRSEHHLSQVDKALRFCKAGSDRKRLRQQNIIDEDRVRKAEKTGEEETKQARKRARMVRKKLIDDDKAKEQDYEAGMF